MRFKSTLLTIGLLGYLLLGASAQAQLLIMPLGDSTTYGYGNENTGAVVPGGYRGYLDADLNALGYGYAHTFVGASTANPTGIAGEDNHNGYIGYTVQDISNNLDGSATPYYGTIDDGNGHNNSNNGGYWLTGGGGTGRGYQRADVTLLMIGSNDIGARLDPGYDASTESVSDFDAHLTLRVEALIQKILVYEPHTDLLVGSVLPFNDTNIDGVNMDDAYVKTFNDDLSAMITSVFGATNQVHYVDQYSSFVNPDGSQNTTLFSSDGIHPTADGYAIMAANWSGAISDTIPEPSTYSLFVLGGIGLFLVHRRRLQRS